MSGADALTDAALAAQAHELVDEIGGDVRYLPELEVTIAAALCAVRDAARVERAEEITVLEEKLDAIDVLREEVMGESVLTIVDRRLDQAEAAAKKRAEEVRQLRKALECDHDRYVDLVTALLDIAQGNWPTPDDRRTFKTSEFAKWMQARAREILAKHRLLIPAATKPSHG